MTEIEKEIDRACSMSAFDAVKVFSATKARERARLGEDITTWMAEHPRLKVVDKVVTQSSDSEFHCFTITLFCKSMV